MASTLSKVVYIPCTRPTAARHMMAAHTGLESGPAVRLVAFRDARDAMRAMRSVFAGDVDLVIGPRLRYTIPRTLEEGHVWATTAEAIVNSGVQSFFLDICEFQEPDEAVVTTSFNVTVAEIDADVAKALMTMSWQLTE